MKKRVTCFGVWKKTLARGVRRALATHGRLSKICVRTRPGLTAYAVMWRSSADSRRCNSSTCRILQSLDLAYWMYLAQQLVSSELWRPPMRSLKKDTPQQIVLLGKFQIRPSILPACCSPCAAAATAPADAGDYTCSTWPAIAPL